MAGGCKRAGRKKGVSRSEMSRKFLVGQGRRNLEALCVCHVGSVGSLRPEPLRQARALAWQADPAAQRQSILCDDSPADSESPLISRPGSLGTGRRGVGVANSDLLRRVSLRRIDRPVSEVIGARVVSSH